MKILFTGFEPFGNEERNPSMEAVSLLPDLIGDAGIVKAVLPVERLRSLDMIRHLIEVHRPDIIISTGVAGGRKGISLERAALNIDDFRIADNGGNRPRDLRIFNGGPDAYFSALPLRQIEEALCRCGIEAHISNSAGTFVCNHVFFGTRYICEHEYPSVKSGFIHVPYCTEQGKTDLPSMPLAEIVRALTVAGETAAQSQICQLPD